jgi:hypothetical protein
VNYKNIVSLSIHCTYNKGLSIIFTWVFTRHWIWMSIHDGGCCGCCCAGVARIAEALIAIANPPQHFHRFPWNDNKKQKKNIVTEEKWGWGKSGQKWSSLTRVICTQR